MEDIQPSYLIPEEGLDDSAQNPQSDFPRWTESNTSLTEVPPATPLQATETSGKKSKRAERAVNHVGKVSFSVGPEQLIRSLQMSPFLHSNEDDGPLKINESPALLQSAHSESQTQHPKSVPTLGPKTEAAQSKVPVLKMQPANVTTPKSDTAPTTAQPDKTMIDYLRRQRNDDDGRHLETPSPRTLKSLGLNRPQQESKLPGKSTKGMAKTQLSAPTRTKTNHRLLLNPKGSTQRKSAETKSSNPSGLKQSKATSKSSVSKKTSPDSPAEMYQAKTFTEKLSHDLKVGNNSFPPQSGLVISKSALVHMSSPLRRNSFKSFPSSVPAKNPDSLGPNKDVLRNSTCVPGKYTALFEFLKRVRVLENPPRCILFIKSYKVFCDLCCC